MKRVDKNYNIFISWL